MAEEMIGGIPRGQIADTIEARGIPGDAGSTRTVHFLRKLAALVETRIAAGEAADGALFLLAKSVSETIIGRTTEPRPLLVNGNDPIGGKVWLLNAALGNAHITTLTWQTGGSFAEIVADGLGHLPAVALDLRSTASGPKLLFFPDGCGNPEATIPVVMSGGPIDAALMKETLDRFFDDNLRTPMAVLDGHGDRIWSDASKGVPQPRPEERIEARLLDRLRSVFPNHLSRAEAPTEDGYLDIAVNYPDRTAAGHPARRCDWVLELKALADRTANDNPSTASSTDAVIKGVRQAIAYGTREQSISQALCVYDMRDTEEDDAQCFCIVREDAEDNCVHLWRWLLLRSAEEGRRERYPLKADAIIRKGKPGNSGDSASA